MKYKAFIKQKGGGCDYTIACGETVIDIDANSMEEANEKMVEIIKKTYHDEFMLDSAQIFEVSQILTLNVKSIYIEFETERKRLIKEAKDLKELKEFERLKAKFGN